MCTQKDNTTVKIIDFGTAKELEPGTAIKVLCGTPEFVAPEVIFVQIVRLIKCISQAITSLRWSDTTSYPQDQVKNVSKVNFDDGARTFCAADIADVFRVITFII